MPNRTWVLFLVSLACVLALSASAPAEEVGGARDLRGLLEHKAELGLSESQSAAIDKAMDEMKSGVAPLRERLKPILSDFQQLAANKGSRDAMRAKLREMAEVQIEIRLLQIDAYYKITEVLTMEQRARWRQIVRSMAPVD